MTRARARFFYPASCHRARMTRRQLLAGSGAVVAASALGVREARAGDDGTAVVDRWATRPEDPWAVCHGVRAMGREFKVEGGRRAVDWLLETHLAEVAITIGSSRRSAGPPGTRRTRSSRSWGTAPSAWPSPSGAGW